MNKFELKDTAVSWVYEAATFIKDKMKQSIEVDTKSNKDDLVTDVDEGVEALFLEKLKETYPEHRLMGEEGSFESIKDLDGIVWILDPIDGTINFVHMESFFAISIGIFKDGKPLIGIVYDVMKDDLFVSVKGEGATLNGDQLLPHADRKLDEAIVSFNTGWLLKDRRLEEVVKHVRGTRSYGVAALEMAYVAAGKLDAYISYHLAPWDVAGGAALLDEVGGKMTNVKGEKLTFLEKDSLFAANPSIYDAIVDVSGITKD
ncbi:inositol monophosphatase family protein [Paenalkalicoccus suaedae]|uniref:inositol-phosphate phosphatase n=1 Tax=Paenalkalicoccus suaedae TaxID=2592382 RepID=A0A859FH82_9BACI|nr:inositol monophosphatase family protein [Paenalkalicoccus suaedae]QKS71565.1 inositol monophosphatase family protein [Paenalkalicoccus suaedae]